MSDSLSRQTLRALVAALFAIPFVSTLPAGAQSESPDDRGTITLLVENDSIVTSTDRHYTSGLRLSWLSSENVPGWVRRIGDALPVFDPDSRRRFGVALGQSFFTPEDIRSEQPILNDRPYAGWLYGAISLTADTGVRLDTFELDLGVVGPSAQAEGVQNNFHDLIGSPIANGWDNQLRDEPGVVLFYERKWRALWELDTGRVGVDVTPHVGAALGNVFTYAAGGLMLRVGQDLPSDYGPPRIRPALPGSGFFTPRAGFGWYLFAGTEGRAVARDIFLDGNTFKDSQSVDKKPLVGDFQAGLAITFDSIRLAYTHVWRTREFDAQGSPDRFGALSLSVRW